MKQRYTPSEEASYRPSGYQSSIATRPTENAPASSSVYLIHLTVMDPWDQSTRLGRIIDINLILRTVEWRRISDQSRCHCRKWYMVAVRPARGLGPRPTDVASSLRHVTDSSLSRSHRLAVSSKTFYKRLTAVQLILYFEFTIRSRKRAGR